MKLLSIVDFGLSTFYLENNKHIEPDEKISGTCVCPYTSVYAQKHKRRSRRDDIESIAYMLIEFLHGKRPWTSIKNANIIAILKTIMKIEVRRKNQNFVFS